MTEQQDYVTWSWERAPMRCVVGHGQEVNPSSVGHTQRCRHQHIWAAVVVFVGLYASTDVFPKVLSLRTREDTTCMAFIRSSVYRNVEDGRVRVGLNPCLEVERRDTAQETMPANCVLFLFLFF